MKPDNDAEPIPASEQDQADDQQAVPVLPCRHESANASILLPLAVARGFVTPSQSAPDLRSPAHSGPCRPFTITRDTLIVPRPLATRSSAAIRLALLPPEEDIQVQRVSRLRVAAVLPVRSDRLALLAALDGP